MRSGSHGGVTWALLKHYCFTAGHHFYECRELNIKNPLFIANGGFLCFFWGIWCGARDGCSFKMAVGMARFVQREGQARSPTKSEGDRANAKPYKHTDDCSTKSDWDSAEWRSRWGAVGAVKASLLYCRTPF